MTRCFIGILLPEKVKDGILSVQKELSEFPMECKLVEPENLHICLSFLGEVGGEKIEIIGQRLASVGSSSVKFTAVISGLKLIPTERYVRVIALDVFDERRMMIMLSKNIQEQVGGDAKPPHITLCRVKNIRDKQLFAERVKGLKTDIGEFAVDKICLIGSELRRQGPVYSVLSEASLS